MKIAVIGATGMIGTELVRELLARGHQVTGIVRTIANLPRHDNLTAVSADIMQPDAMARALAGHDAVICAFAPGHTMGLDIYKGAVEGAWRIKRAVKSAGSPYLVYVGGVGSLWTERGVQMMDDPWWPDWYISTSTPAYMRHLRDMTHIEGFELLAREREQMDACGAAPNAPLQSDEARGFIAALGGGHELAQGLRAAFEIFAQDRTFDWTFASPPWCLMHGPRTGFYAVSKHDIPLNGDVPAGISVKDMAVALVDEAENRRLPFEHWSASTDLR
jgi:uncharacterized protein